LHTRAPSAREFNEPRSRIKDTQLRTVFFPSDVVDLVGTVASKRAIFRRLINRRVRTQIPTRRLCASDGQATRGDRADGDNTQPGGDWRQPIRSFFPLDRNFFSKRNYRSAAPGNQRCLGCVRTRNKLLVWRSGMAATAATSRGSTVS